MPNFVLGMNAKIYLGAVPDPDSPPAIGALAELDNVKDVTLNLEASEADTTTRANEGWKASAATLREATVEFQMVWKTTDSGFTIIRDAFLGSNLVEFAVLDGDKGVSDNQGLKGSFTITSFSRSEALEDAIMVDVSAKLNKFDSWVTT